MADLIKITRDDVTLGGAMRKAGNVIPAHLVPEGVRALVKAGSVVGAEWVEGEVDAEEVVNPSLVPPITMTYNTAGQAVKIHLPGPWGERGDVVATPVPVREEITPPAPVTVTQDAPPTENTPSILDGTVDEVKAAIGAMDADDLRTLRVAESEGKKRTGVLTAIDARLAELG